MPNGTYLRPNRKEGQSIVEATALMPIFLLLMFSLLQACHLGIAIAIVNYAASSAAREAVQQNDPKASGAAQKFKSLLSAGLQFISIDGKPDLESDPVAPNITVDACAQLPAYPFVGQFLSKALKSTGSDKCGGTMALGPVALKGPAPFYFTIHGQASARMNYNPNPNG